MLNPPPLWNFPPHIQIPQLLSPLLPLLLSSSVLSVNLIDISPIDFSAFLFFFFFHFFHFPLVWDSFLWFLFFLYIFLVGGRKTFSVVLFEKLFQYCWWEWGGEGVFVEKRKIITNKKKNLWNWLFVWRVFIILLCIFVGGIFPRGVGGG